MGHESPANAVRTMVHGFAALYPDEVAAIVENLPDEEAAAVLEDMAPSTSLEVLQRTTLETASVILARLSEAAVQKILPEMEPARAAAVLVRLEGDARRRLLSQLPPRLSKELQQLLSYSRDSAGYLMDPRVTTFRTDATVEQALTRLRQRPPKRIYSVFLVGSEGRLAGAVPIQEFALANPEVRLEQLARPTVSIPATGGREEVVEILDQHKLASLPVVDFEGKLIGVIRHDVLVATAEQELSADLQTMTGAGKEERALSKVSFAVQKRLPWLQINLGTAFLAASIVGLFEETIAQFTALAVLLPVVAGQSGNTGAQALVVTMRGLALREITLRHWLRVTTKEAITGVVNGIAVSAVTMLGVYIWSGSYGLCLVIGAAMVTAMAIAGIAGALIPILLSAAGQDPAQSSSIILTTVTDVFGFFSFLSLATLFSGML